MCLQNAKVSKEARLLGERPLCSQPQAWIQGTQISLPRAILSSPCPRGHLCQSLLEFLQTPQAAKCPFHCILHQPRPPSKTWDFQGLPRGEFTTSLTHHSCCTSEGVLVPIPPTHTSILQARGSNQGQCLSGDPQEQSLWAASQGRHSP